MTKGGDPNLYAAISAGLVDMMDDGDASEMLKYEDEWFGDFTKSEHLRSTVNALSDLSIGSSNDIVTTAIGGDASVSGGGKGSVGCVVLLLCFVMSMLFV